MGETVGTTFAILGGALRGLSAEQTVQGAQAQRENIRSRRAQERIAASQRSIQRTEELAKVLSANIARAGAQGRDLSSTSFQAVQASNFNVFSEDQAADALNTEFRDRFLQQQISNVDMAERASLINLAKSSAQDAFLLSSPAGKTESGLFSFDKKGKS